MLLTHAEQEPEYERVKTCNSFLYLASLSNAMIGSWQNMFKVWCFGLSRIPCSKFLDRYVHSSPFFVTRPFQIAIDGPAASGKSTTARATASKFGFTYIDSGAMYRSLTLKAMSKNMNPKTDAKSIAQMAHQTNFAFRTPNLNDTSLASLAAAVTHVYMDGVDVTHEIRSPTVTRNIAPIAAISSVRDVLTQKMRAIAEGKEGCTAEVVQPDRRGDVKYKIREQDYGSKKDLQERPRGVVMDGRDIGTNVLKDAQLKIFFEASPIVRAKRRLAEMEEQIAKGHARRKLPTLDEVLQDIEARDHADRTRAVGPLIEADDAIVLDASNMTLEQQIRTTEEIIRKRMADVGFV